MAVARVTSFSAVSAVDNSGAVRVSAIHVKQATAGQASDTFLSLWNTTSGAVSLGTTAPEFTCIIPRASRSGLKGIHKVIFPGGGLRFNTACAVAITTTYNGATGATTTAPDSAEVFYAIEH